MVRRIFHRIFTPLALRSGHPRRPRSVFPQEALHHDGLPLGRNTWAHRAGVANKAIADRVVAVVARMDYNGNRHSTILPA